MKRKAIIYVRVSTDEQAEKGYSLKYQVERLQAYCDANNIAVVTTISEDYSAKTFERPEFIRLLEQLRRKTIQVDLILFTKWDRFSRNAPDAYTMIKRLKKFGIEPQAIEQPLDISIPENKLMLAIFLTAPEVENDRRALNVIGGMRRARKEGRWMTQAPQGYRNTVTENNKKIILPDKDAPLIKWVFEETAKGVTNVFEVWKIATEKGLRCSKNNIWNILRNPVYMGKIPVAAYKEEPAYLADGLHEPIISEKLFYDVQDVLDSRRRNVPTKNTRQDELPLRGFLICKRCGKLLTGSASKGNGGKYFYYHCQKGCCERFKAGLANELFVEGLKDFNTKSNAIDMYLTTLKRAFLLNQEDNANNVGVYKKEVEKIRERLYSAQTMMLDRLIEPTEFREIKSRLEPEIERLERKINNVQSGIGNYSAYISGGIDLLRNMPNFFVDADLRSKQQFIGSIFPEKLIFENNTYRTTQFILPFNRILSIGAAFGGKKKGTETKIMFQSTQVAGDGFEPTPFPLGKGRLQRSK